MVRNREEAAKRAEAAKNNTPDTCQLWVRLLFDAPSVGDFDGDGAADAEDGWKSEPASARHTDRKPPRGVPVAYLGGSHDNGHRAISLGNGKIRSTDAGGTGHIATVDLDWPEKHWGLKYAGWSDTIDGKKIPLAPKPEVKEPAVTVNPVVFGVDLSHFQLDNGFKLELLKPQGYQFVILKCTQGVTWVDSTYAKAQAKAKDLGLLTAVYHFLEHGDAGKQAQNLAKHIVDKSLPVFIDVEPTDSPVSGAKHSQPTAEDWIEFRRAATKLGLNVKAKYLTSSYWMEIGSPSLIGTLVLWRAAYPSNAHDYGSKLYPGNDHERWKPFGGLTPTLWQFASSGKLDGFSGNVDLNAFKGTLKQLKAKKLFKNYGEAPVVTTPKPKPAPAPKPTPKPEPRTKDFLVHLVPGNKKESVDEVKADMAAVKKLTRGNSAIVFNTERESSSLRTAVSDGLGKGWTRVLENENTIAYGSNWAAFGTPTALLLAKDDPSMAGVSPKRYLDTFPGENKFLKGVEIKFKGTHLLSEANCEHVHVLGRAWREKMYPIQLNDVLADVKKDHDAGYPVVLAMDANTGINFTGNQMFAWFQKLFGDNAVHVHNGALDQIVLVSTPKVKLEEVGVEVKTKNKSDHALVTATIRATIR